MQIQDLYRQINQKTLREYPLSVLSEVIEKQANATPEAIAVLCDDQVQTFAELNEKSNQLANYLIDNGINSGDLVGLCCDRNLQMPAMLLGILKTGAAYVPLDPEYPIDRLKYMVENSETKHVIANENQLDIVNDFQVATTIADRDWDSVAATGSQPVSTKAQPNDLAYVIYTSGSTGKPKGVLVPHDAAVNFLLSMKEVLQFTTEDRTLATTTLSFDISVLEIFLPLVCGGSVVILDRQSAKDQVVLVEAIERYGTSMMQATPAMWRMIVEADFKGGPNMKFVTGGEPLPRDLIDPLVSRASEVWNMYGPTETTVYSSVELVKNSADRILIGDPIANTSLYIVDEDNNLCPPEVPGELLIGGRGVTQGYLKRDELTSEKFFQFQGELVYRSGDLARITETGKIDHMGRMDGQIKFNGHRIELDEIDGAMSSQPGVRQAATVLREDRPGDKRLVGYLLAEENKQPNIAQVRQNISEILPNYMVPNVIVVVDQFHYTPSGKLDRKGFAAPTTERPDIGTEFVAAKTEDEIQLAKIWGDVLQLDQVGVRDNFFDLGGNSLRAVKVVTRAKEELGIAANSAEFFDNPTIQAFLGMAQSKMKLIAKLQSKTKRNQNRSDEHEGQYAIVGMSARMPGAKDLNEFWDNLVEGRESIKFFTQEELDPTLDPAETSDPNYVAARGIIDHADHFDARFFRTQPKYAELTDPQQRILLELSWTALEDAGIIPNKTEETIGIWAGTYTTSYFFKNVLSNRDLISQIGEFQAGIYNEKDYIATRVAHALNFTGPAINVNTACSTSLVALIEACKSLEDGHCDVALAGGASVTFPQNSGHLHQTGSIFSPDGHCRPFDAQSAGTLFSDGAGIVVVKRLEDAIANGDRVYAVVKGFGINNDGAEKASFSAPSINGQAGAVAMAQSMAQVDAESIGYIEAHGTATPIGDPIEVSALKTVFEAQTEKKQFCAIGSVKSNIGHTVAAAGVAGLIKVAMSLHHEKIPATLHYSEPNPQINFEESPFYVCDSLQPWDRSESPRRGGVSSFGVGGTNAHILLEEAPLTEKSNVASVEELPIHVLPISAKTEEALESNVQNVADFCLGSDNPPLTNIAHTLQQGRDEFVWRAAVVAQSKSEAGEILRDKKPLRFIKRKASTTNRDIVFMFPGQGSQYVRMGQNLYQHSSVFRESLDHCCELLLPLLGRDLRDVLFPESQDVTASEEILRNTRFTQPALFALGYSLAKVWMAWGVKPTALMGHSIGEFAAACVAGVFSLEDGLKMIAERGRAMEALPGGSMMSVRLPGADVEPMLWGEMAIGSYNGPKLCVVAGPNDQVAQLQKQLDDQGVVCKHLHTSHAFHSPMMNEIVDPFEEFVSQFQLSRPEIPILSTVTADWMTDEQATDARYWADHLRMPVRFSEAVTRMWCKEQGDPTRILIELGPRKTLATLSKQHAEDPKNQISIPALSDNAEANAEWQQMLWAVAQVWLAGAEIQWGALTGNGNEKPGQTISLPTYAFQRKRFFIEPPAANIAEQKEVCENTQFDSNSSSNSTSQTPTQEVSSLAADPKQSKSLSERKNMSRIPNLVQVIVDVFEDTSGCDLTEYDGDTTFFEMGLDSLVLTQTATALKKETEFDVTFRQMLESTPTVNSLAEFLDQNLPEGKYASEDETPVEEVIVEQVASVANTVSSVSSVKQDCDSIQLSSAEPQSQSAQLAAQPQPMSQPLQPQPMVQQQPAQPMPVQTLPPVAQGAWNGGTQAIVQSQIQLMAAQLQLLNGQGVVQPVQQSTMISQPPVQTPQHVQPAVAANPIGSSADTLVAQQPTQAADPKEINQLNKSQPSAPKTNPQKQDKIEEPAAPKAKRFSTVKLNEGELDERQQKALDEIIRMNNIMMPGSKAYAQRYRQYMADPRTVSGFRPNMKEMTHPIVVERSKGVYLWDVDGNEYIDFTCGFGSNLLGHSHEITVKAISEQVQKDYSIGPQSPLAGEVAKLFCEVTGNERMAFSNTGSEAVLGCTRLARNKTGRDLIVMFNGDYHGILDEVIARGSKKLKSYPAATGIPKDHVGKTLILDYGTDETLEIIRDRMDEIAAILVEPVQSRKPELQPREFLLKLREMTLNEPTALIFDEVISGLRIGLGGAQEFFGVKADLASYGKVVGGGMPIGVVAGKAEYMDGLDGGYWEFGDDSRPEAGMTYYAGTFVRHPLTLAASKAILEHLRDGGKPMYDRLNQLSDYLGDELNKVFESLDAPMYLANFGSLFKIQFHQELVYSEVFFAGLRRRGMHIWDHRPCLVTLSHEKEHIDQLVAAVRDTTIECQRYGFMPGEGYKKFPESFDENSPPRAGAKVGKDKNGNKGWFVPDTRNPGQYVQVGLLS